MSNYFAIARAFLASITPDLPPALLIVLVFVGVYSLRRWFPGAWVKFEHAVPFVDTIDPGPGMKVLLKFWQAIPGAIIAAVGGALFTGASVKLAVWAVVSTAVATAAHEIGTDYATLKSANQLHAVAARRKPPASPPSLTVVGFLGVLCLSLAGCGLLAAAAPYLAEAGVLIADATNAVNAADDLLPSLHLTGKEEADAETAIAKARKGIAAAAALDNGAKDLTSAQLDASLAEFRASWADVQSIFASKQLGAAPASDALPVPIAMKRAYQ